MVNLWKFLGNVFWYVSHYFHYLIHVTLLGMKKIMKKWLKNNIYNEADSAASLYSAASLQLLHFKKKTLFFNFGPISLKIGYYMQNSKRKRLALSFLRLDHNFLRYSHFCVQKNDFFWFLPKFQSVSPPTIFELEKKFWCHFVPLLTARKNTLCFFQFQSRLVSTKDFVIAFLQGRKIAKNAVFSIRLQWLREN